MTPAKGSEDISRAIDSEAVPTSRATHTSGGHHVVQQTCRTRQDDMDKTFNALPSRRDDDRLDRQEAKEEGKKKKKWGPTRNRTGDLCQLRIGNTLRQHNKPLYD